MKFSLQNEKIAAIQNEGNNLSKNPFVSSWMR